MINLPTVNFHRATEKRRRSLAAALRFSVLRTKQSFSHAGKAGWALLEVRYHAFAEVGALEALEHEADGFLLGGAEVGGEVLIDLPLHDHHRGRRAVGGDLLDVAAREGDE